MTTWEILTVVGVGALLVLVFILLVQENDRLTKQLKDHHADLDYMYEHARREVDLRSRKL